MKKLGACCWEKYQDRSRRTAGAGQYWARVAGREENGLFGGDQEVGCVNEESCLLLASMKHRGGMMGGVNVHLSEAAVPGRIVASILNITQCKGGDKEMKAIMGSAVARLQGWD